MYQDPRKLIRFALFGILIIGIILYVITYFTSTRTVKIAAKNITSFSLNEKDDMGTAKKNPPSKTSVRLKKGRAYTLSYIGRSGYDNGMTAITPTTTTITINPDYSTEKSDKMLDAEISAINGVITKSGTSIDTLYTIQRGILSHFGEWYFTTLKYRGSPDDESSDTLVVGLQKKQGKWVTILPPDIIFTTAAYPDAPRDFINAANAYQNTHITPVGE